MNRCLSAVIILLILLQSCTNVNHLEKCKSKLLALEAGKIAKCNFEEEFRDLDHNSEPWETSNYERNGTVWVNNTTFLKVDTITDVHGRKYISKANYNDGVFLYVDYGDTELLPMTEDMYFEKLISTAYYSPVIVLNYFINHDANTTVEYSGNQDIYSLIIGNNNVRLAINKTTSLVNEISYLSHDELYGDVSTKFIYSSYVADSGLTYPASIRIEKVNGMVVDTVNILSMEIIAEGNKLLEQPKGYKIITQKEEEISKIKVNKYNQYIHFIDLEHTDDKVMVVEFDDYMLVAEAPINSENGELIIDEVKKIAPSKPIKYFVFGHHHPHYLGGLRAFVHKEATILCTEISKGYVEYIANAPRTLSPDSLYLDPKKIKTQIISDSLVLGTDNKMKIYFIGEKSAHTKDYLIYYFPSDKILFEDDLCWVPREGAITKAGSRQAGLYNAIKELNLNIDTIIQSWPVKSYKVKTIIPFTDLEKSMKIKKQS